MDADRLANRPVVELRAMERLASVSDVMRQDARGADEIGHLALFREADHLLINLPDPEGQQAFFGFDIAVIVQLVVETLPNRRINIARFLCQIEERFARKYRPGTDRVHVGEVIWTFFTASYACGAGLPHQVGHVGKRDEAGELLEDPGLLVLATVLNSLNLEADATDVFVEQGG